MTEMKLPGNMFLLFSFILGHLFVGNAEFTQTSCIPEPGAVSPHTTHFTDEFERSLGSYACHSCYSRDHEIHIIGTIYGTFEAVGSEEKTVVTFNLFHNASTPKLPLKLFLFSLSLIDWHIVLHDDLVLTDVLLLGFSLYSRTPEVTTVNNPVEVSVVHDNVALPTSTDLVDLGEWVRKIWGQYSALGYSYYTSFVVEDFVKYWNVTTGISEDCVPTSGPLFPPTSTGQNSNAGLSPVIIAVVVSAVALVLISLAVVSVLCYRYHVAKQKHSKDKLPIPDLVQVYPPKHPTKAPDPPPREVYTSKIPPDVYDWCNSIPDNVDEGGNVNIDISDDNYANRADMSTSHDKLEGSVKMDRFGNINDSSDKPYHAYDNNMTESTCENGVSENNPHHANDNNKAGNTDASKAGLSDDKPYHAYDNNINEITNDNQGGPMGDKPCQAYNNKKAEIINDDESDIEEETGHYNEHPKSVSVKWKELQSPLQTAYNNDLYASNEEITSATNEKFEKPIQSDYNKNNSTDIKPYQTLISVIKDKCQGMNTIEITALPEEEPNVTIDKSSEKRFTVRW